MDMKKCDRCKKPYDFYKTRNVLGTVYLEKCYAGVYNGNNYEEARVDLCQDCVKSFNNWLDRKEESDGSTEESS